MQIEIKNLAQISDQFKAISQGIKTKADLDLIRRDWLSKDGVVRKLFGQLRDVAGADKPRVAQELNQLKELVEGTVEQYDKKFSQSAQSEKLSAEFVDCSLPGQTPGFGALHPMTKVERRISEILRPFGFTSVIGPELETEYFCFDSLNIQPHHPARDMQDTFYAETGHVLRTHTTSVQTRTLKKGGQPIKIASFGRVYRNETEDASHQAMFHQYELVWIEKGLTTSHLVGLITHILKSLYGNERKVKFVPKYYPYTEPSLGPQIDCGLCKGEGCSACGGAGWVTIGGSGMVHRKVLKEFGYDPEQVSGIAFGLGSSRLVGQFFKVPTLKMMYENDLRVLQDLA